MLGVLDDERCGFFRSTVVARLEQVDVSRLAGQLLDVLTAEQRHQQQFDGMLQQLAHTLDDETIKAEVAEVIAAEVKYLCFVGLGNVAGRYATEKTVAGVVRLVGEMGADPNHPLRLRFDEFAAFFIERLKDDPDFAPQRRGDQAGAARAHHTLNLSAWTLERNDRLGAG